MDIRRLKGKVIRNIKRTIGNNSGYLGSFFRQTKGIEEVNYYQAMQILRNAPNSILVDVRSPQEYREFHLQGAINIPLYDITSSNMRKEIPNKETTIITYCQIGKRSKEAATRLLDLEYSNIYLIKGGLEVNDKYF